MWYDIFREHVFLMCKLLIKVRVLLNECVLCLHSFFSEILKCLIVLLKYLSMVIYINNDLNVILTVCELNCSKNHNLNEWAFSVQIAIWYKHELFLRLFCYC